MLLTLVFLAQTAAATAVPAPTAKPEMTTRKPALTGGFGTPVGTSRAGQGAMTVPGRAPQSLAFTEAPPPAVPAAPSGLPVAAGGSEAERYWRGRLATAQAAVTAAEGELRSVENDTVVTTAPARGPVVWNGQPTGRPIDPDSTIGRAAREKAAEPYRARVAEAKKGIDAVREECRRTDGCLPAWVR